MLPTRIPVDPAVPLCRTPPPEGFAIRRAVPPEELSGPRIPTPKDQIALLMIHFGLVARNNKNWNG